MVVAITREQSAEGETEQGGRNPSMTLVIRQTSFLPNLQLRPENVEVGDDDFLPLYELLAILLDGNVVTANPTLAPKVAKSDVDDVASNN